MPIERQPATTALVDVLDRVLDKGIVVDAWIRLSLVGIDLITVEARVVVASIATYLQYSDVVAQSAVRLTPPRDDAHGTSMARHRRKKAIGPVTPPAPLTADGPRLGGGAVAS